MFQDSPYRDEINRAILKLKESRVLQDIKDKWWKEKYLKTVNGEVVNCTEENKTTSSDEPDLDLEHIWGVFLVLIGGIAIAIFIGILEFLWNVRKVSIALKVIYGLRRDMPDC